MVKLASAREIRQYGPWRVRHRSEYMNAGLYLFSTVVLEMGFLAQLSSEPKSGLVLLLIAFALIAAVNLHDLIAHLAGIDYRLQLMEYDTQLALVEFAVPLVQALGSIVSFFAILFIFVQVEKGIGYHRVENYALNMLIIGPVLWMIGSIHNSCQIYERADGHVQVLQESVHLPFLLGSLLFLLAAIFNRIDLSEWSHAHHHGLLLLSKRFVWMGMVGSVLLFIGGLANVVKVFKMQQPNELRLEKLRGGAQERLMQEREGQVPFMMDQNITTQRKLRMPEPNLHVASTPYKDVLLGTS